MTILRSPSESLQRANDGRACNRGLNSVKFDHNFKKKKYDPTFCRLIVCSSLRENENARAEFIMDL